MLSSQLLITNGAVTNKTNKKRSILNYNNRILCTVILTHRADSAHTELGFLPALVVPNLPEAQKIYPLTSIITVVIFILLQCHNIVQVDGSIVRNVGC